MKAAMFLAVWFAASVPVSLLVARVLRARRLEEEEAALEEAHQLTRLVAVANLYAWTQEGSK